MPAAVKFDWSEFCSLARSIPEVASCMDDELRQVLVQPTPPARHTDKVGRPLPGSSLINEHPDLAGYRRVADIRRRICIEAGDGLAGRYLDRVVGFLKSHSAATQMWIVELSTQRECYEILYFAGEKTGLFSPTRYLEGRELEKI